MGAVQLTRARDRLLSVDQAGGSAQAVCAEIVHAMHDVATFVQCSVMTTDPETNLPSGGVVEGFESEDCAPFWDNELLDPDFNKFNDLARSTDPVATLVDAVDGDLGRSPRYRKLYAGVGATDELRVAFVAGTSCLAIGVFVRPAGSGPFFPGELADVRALVPVATRVLRRSLGRPHAAIVGPPSVVMLDSECSVTWSTVGAEHLLRDLRTALDDEGVPSIIRAAATKVRWSRTATSVATRVRDDTGRWLRVTVSPVEAEVGAVVVVIEPARSDDLVPVLLESYGLTGRETDVVLHLARGLSLKEIAAELVISVHTVRDHVKEIYGKAGVSSRGELVAALFSKHVIDSFHASVDHVQATRS